MLATCLVVLAVAPAAPFKAASAGLTVSGMPADRAEFYSELVAQQMASAGLKIVTPKEVLTMLGMERQRELLGCTDSSASCVAEMASALGTDGVVQGEVARLDSGGYQVSLKVVWSRDGRPLALFTGRAADEAGLLDVMGKGAQLIAQDLSEGDWVRWTAAPSTHSIVPRSSGRVLTWVPAAVGAVALGLCIFGFLRANTLANQLTTGTFASREEAAALGSEGKTMQTLGVIMAGVAAAGLVATGVLFFLRSDDVKPALALWPGGASFGLTGALP